MRIVVNQLTALGRKTGIGHYVEQLLRCLRAGAGANTVDAYPMGWPGKLVRTPGAARTRLDPDGAASPFWAAARARLLHSARTIRETALGNHFRLVCRWRNYDIYHEPNYIPFDVDCPTVATIHDLSVLRPEWHPADRVAHFERHLARLPDRCRHFVAVSEFTRQEMIRLLGIAPDRITRVYNGVRPEFYPRPEQVVARRLRELRFPERYLLHVGTLEPRKNVLRLLQAYCSLEPVLRDRWPLVLVGSWGWNSTAIARYVDEVARHCGVRHVGYVANADLPVVCQGARALLYPSHYEGFGLPPLEMMACGGAVLASTAGALAELFGRHAHLVPAEDSDGWRTALQRVLTDDGWHAQLCQGVQELAQPFTWERCAAETLAVYRVAAGKVPTVSVGRRTHQAPPGSEHRSDVA